VNLELGHVAKTLDVVTLSGHTHEWIMFVKGADKMAIEHFVEKVSTISCFCNVYTIPVHIIDLFLNFFVVHLPPCDLFILDIKILDFLLVHKSL